MKQIAKLFVFAMAVLTLNNAIAQTNGQKTKPAYGKQRQDRPNGKQKLTPEQRATKNTDSLRVRLNLTDDQYAKILSINTGFLKSKDALRIKTKTDSTYTKETFKTDLKSIHADRKKQIEAILTPEQKKTWAAWKKSQSGNTKATNNTKPIMNNDEIDSAQD